MILLILLAARAIYGNLTVIKNAPHPNAAKLCQLAARRRRPGNIQQSDGVATRRFDVDT